MRMNHRTSMVSALAVAALGLCIAPVAAAQGHSRGGQAGHGSGAPRPVQGAPSRMAPSLATPSLVPPQASRDSRANAISGDATSRYGSLRGVQPLFFASRSIIVPRYMHVYQPYYVFRPRFGFSFGLFVGYPVAYPTWYDPYYEYYDLYPYPYASSYGLTAAPRVAYGGVSFEITPANAEVWVDGNYVGLVGDFGPTEAPLTLTGGQHHIEIGAEGFQPMVFDITVVAGQVIPYRGALAIAR